MTAKEFVKKKYPRARAERQVAGRVCKIAYWLVRPNMGEMYIGTGKTESSAWVSAKKGIEEAEVRMDKQYRDLLTRTQEKVAAIKEDFLGDKMSMAEYIHQSRQALGVYVILCDENGWKEKPEYKILAREYWDFGSM